MSPDVVVHIARQGADRQVTEIAVLQRDKAGLVQVIPAWRAGNELLSGTTALHRMIDERRR